MEPTLEVINALHVSENCNVWTRVHVAMAFPDHASTGADEPECQRTHLASAGCRSTDVPGAVIKRQHL
eukprot:363383-Pyramimonas_sp.AAC.1